MIVELGNVAHSEEAILWFLEMAIPFGLATPVVV